MTVSGWLDVSVELLGLCHFFSFYSVVWLSLIEGWLKMEIKGSCGLVSGWPVDVCRGQAAVLVRGLRLIVGTSTTQCSKSQAITPHCVLLPCSILCPLCKAWSSLYSTHSALFHPILSALWSTSLIVGLLSLRAPPLS